MVLRERSFDQVTAYAPTFGNGRAVTSSVSHSVFNSSLLSSLICCYKSLRDEELKKAEHLSTTNDPAVKCWSMYVNVFQPKKKDLFVCSTA